MSMGQNTSSAALLKYSHKLPLAQEVLDKTVKDIEVVKSI